MSDRTRHHLIVVFACCIGLVLSAGILVYVLRVTRAADSQVTITDGQLEQESVVTKDSAITSFSLYSSDEEGIYDSSLENAGAAYEFLQKKVTVEYSDNVQGVAADSVPAQSTVSILPGSFANRVKPVRTVTDADNPFATPDQNARLAPVKHYYFTQKINEVPVYGTHVAVHVRANKVYAASGAIVNSDAVEAKKITIDEALQRAKEFALELTNTPTVLRSEAVLVNLAVAGIGDDTHTYPAQRVIITDGSTPSPVAHAYFISLTDGRLLYNQELVSDALNRAVCDAQELEDTGSCTLRTETSAPSTVVQVESIFTIFGSIYQYYADAFGRDSYNDAGGRIDVYARIPNSVTNSLGGAFCPNAAWNGGQNNFMICSGFEVNDVLAHEYSHALVQYTAQLDYGDESGAIDEGLADVFSTIVDDDWLLGEDLPFGYLRDLSDPAKNKTLTKTSSGTIVTIDRANPKKLFDPAYYCGTEDKGGVHRNISIVSYAYYLMAQGTTEGDCPIVPIGKTEALAIWYRALTVYLHQTSNYLTVYQGVLQSCRDLHGEGSDICRRVGNALRLVELDQQQELTQQAPLCSGQTEKPPVCEQAVEPTNTPQPTFPPACNKAGGDIDCSGAVALKDYTIWRDEFVAGCSADTMESCMNDEDGDGREIDADLNGDDTVTFTDYEIWRRGYIGE